MTSTTNSCSPTIQVTFFTILVASSPVAPRNLKYCKDSFNACVEKGDYAIDYMPYGLESAVSAMMKTDNHFFEVLRPNG